jgi:hypothetical protein
MHKCTNNIPLYTALHGHTEQQNTEGKDGRRKSTSGVLGTIYPTSKQAYYVQFADNKK